MICRKSLSPVARRTAVALVFAVLSTSSASAASAQWVTTHEQFYLQGRFNWQFRHNYPAADRLFNAFDYGHAILYERLWTQPGASVAVLEEKEYNFITRELLVHPPRLPLEESAIEIAYAKLAPEAKLMFDWAHLFHRQVYDVWADERITVAEKDAKVGELLRYYKSRPDLAFSSQPKTMGLMEGQPYSLAFRKNYPKFNGLIWAYHWLQVGLYEPLLAGKNKDERQTGVLAAVARFRQMIENPPTNMPRIMPMTAAVAPTFAARYPEAAIIFDNLHSMHDVVSDILANDSVPRDQKRMEIMRAARRYRDATSFVQTPAEWLEMAKMMGVENMGGPSVGFLSTFPAPTVERGAVMTGMDHSRMRMAGDSTAKPAMDHSRMNMPGMRDSVRTRTDSMPAMDHRMRMTGDSTAKPAMDHSKMNMPDSAAGAMGAHMSMIMELYMSMLADPIIRKRLMSDSAMRRKLSDMVEQMPAEHREHMREMMREATPGAPSTPPSKPALRTPSASRSTSRRSPAQAAKPADPHAGHQMPAAKGAVKAPAKPTPKKPTAKKDSMPGMDRSKMPAMKKP